MKGFKLILIISLMSILMSANVKEQKLRVRILETSANGFKIIASPWTAPPWMKDNNDWRSGK